MSTPQRPLGAAVLYQVPLEPGEDLGFDFEFRAWRDGPGGVGEVRVVFVSPGSACARAGVPCGVIEEFNGVAVASLDNLVDEYDAAKRRGQQVFELLLRPDHPAPSGAAQPAHPPAHAAPPAAPPQADFPPPAGPCWGQLDPQHTPPAPAPALGPPPSGAPPAPPTAPGPPAPGMLEWTDPRPAPAGGRIRLWAAGDGACCYTKDGELRPTVRRAAIFASEKYPGCCYLDFPDICRGAVMPVAIMADALQVLDAAGVQHAAAAAAAAAAGDPAAAGEPPEEQRPRGTLPQSLPPLHAAEPAPSAAPPPPGRQPPVGWAPPAGEPPRAAPAADAQQWPDSQPAWTPPPPPAAPPGAALEFTWLAADGSPAPGGGRVRPAPPRRGGRGLPPCFTGSVTLQSGRAEWGVRVSTTAAFACGVVPAKPGGGQQRPDPDAAPLAWFCPGRAEAEVPPGAQMRRLARGGGPFLMHVVCDLSVRRAVQVRCASDAGEADASQWVRLPLPPDVPGWRPCLLLRSGEAEVCRPDLIPAGAADPSVTPRDFVCAFLRGIQGGDAAAVAAERALTQVCSLGPQPGPPGARSPPARPSGPCRSPCPEEIAGLSWPGAARP